MPRLARLKLQNFKSLRDVDLEMRSLNILIGPNGSGKSNLLSFFRLMSQAADGHLADEIRQMRGFKEIRWRGDIGGRIYWELQIELLDEPLFSTIDPVSYSVALHADDDPFLTTNIAEERIQQSLADGEFKYFTSLNNRIKSIASYNVLSDGWREETLTAHRQLSKAQELAITQLRDSLSYPVLDALRRYFVDWTIYRGFGENALKNIQKAQLLDASLPLRLRDDVSNLIPILHTFANEVRFESAYEQLSETLSVAFPDFERFVIKLAAAGNGELFWRTTNKWEFPANSVSDGILRFLGLATLLLLPEPPPLIAIDEPEIGLHPKLLPLLAELLKDASTRTQVVVTTHSPQLISAEAIEPTDIVLVDNEDGETQFDRPDPEKLRLWLDRYTLGGLWMMGKLER